MFRPWFRSPRRPWLSLAASLAVSPAVSLAQSPPTSVGIYQMYEATYTASGSYTNPYAQVTATVTLVDPRSQQRVLPLFWDGGSSWKIRFSPNQTGTWIWAISSSDPGLNGQSGSVPVFSSTSHGGIRRSSAAPYHFEREDGTPFWFLGDTEWSYFTDDATEEHNRTTALHCIDERAAQGFNAIHSILISQDAWPNSGGDPFTDYANEVINPAYWREVDLRLAHANSVGITCGLVLAWANATRDWGDFPSEAARLRFARYVMARYGAYDVYFIVAGEWDEFGGTSFHDKIGLELDAYNIQGRMIGIHSTGSVESWTSSSWMSFGDYQQIYTSLHSAIASARDHSLPVVNSEYAYYRRPTKPNSDTLQQIRDASYDIVMAGGYLLSGFGTTYRGGLNMDGPFNPDDPLDDDWEADAGHMKALFTGLPWTTLAPNDGLLAGTGTRYCLAAPGNTYLAYVRGAGGAVSLSLGASGSATYSVRRFDPRTGLSTSLPGYTGTGPVSLTPPDAQDWVFVLARTGGTAPDTIPPDPPADLR